MATNLEQSNLQQPKIDNAQGVKHNKFTKIKPWVLILSGCVCSFTAKYSADFTANMYKRCVINAYEKEHPSDHIFKVYLFDDTPFRMGLGTLLAQGLIGFGLTVAGTRKLRKDEYSH